ncbi:astacin [Oesophagostomum dentatum]|uniref:Metalloendopeptidase n=1 Tax=Oesophagostomum dentatum TaxID=61180 RepID=A0A0B1T9F2_OESDE|nr:astacin [Oesophagostomum dentatum]
MSLKDILGVTEHNNITRAMRMLESNTCILFRKRSSEEDYIDIQSEEGEGCRAPVGRYGGRNVVVLEASKLGTCLELDTVAHELLHVIGLHHEHVRDDRDNYIKVHWENIEKGHSHQASATTFSGNLLHSFESQFSKVVSDQAISHGVEYDYLSIMHYAKDASAKPGTISLETLDSAYQDLIGKQKEPSKGDYMKVCKIYNCKECMGEPMLPQSITPSECRDRLWQCPNFVSKADDCYHYSVVENCCATCSRVNRS